MRRRASVISSISCPRSASISSASRGLSSGCNFDAIVTDPEVRLADANAHIAKLDGDEYFRDELHAVASGGSSGLRGVFVWGWDAWATVQLTAMRRTLLDRIGDPELASRPPVAMIVAAENATHFTSALSETSPTGAVQTHRFPIGAPLG